MLPQIYPSILSCDFGRLREESLAAEAAGADGLHVDVMDGSFVPNITIGPPVIESLKAYVKIPLDCHLMIINPEKHLKAFADAGTTGITVHYEAVKDLKKTLDEIRSLKCKAGVSLNPETSFEGLEGALPHIDLILCMTVNPGWGGQKLIPAALEKAGKLRKWLDTKGYKKIPVQIDGGVDKTTAIEARKLGLNIFVAGSAIFRNKDYKRAILELRGNSDGSEKHTGVGTKKS